MQLNQMHHLAIIVSDINAAKHFYLEQLGFQLIRETSREQRGDVKLDIRNGELELELFEIKTAPARLSYPEVQGLRHLAFKVTSVEETVRELAERGVECEPIRIDEITGKPMTFFFDPDQLPLELHE